MYQSIRVSCQILTLATIKSSSLLLQLLTNSRGGIPVAFCSHPRYVRHCRPRDLFLALRSVKGCVYHLSQVRNTFQYPLSKRVYMQTPSEMRFSSCCVYHWTLSRVRVERKALSLRSCIAQFYPWSRDHVGRAPLRRSVGDINTFQNESCVSKAFQITLFLVFQRGISNPLIKTALRFNIICKNHPESRLETLILRQKCDDKRTQSHVP